MTKVLERSYPYLGGTAVCIVLWLFKIDLSNSSGIDDALNGIVTMASLVVCFLGAVLPLIVTARTDSKVVNKVFELDSSGLFFKYIRETVFIGLALVITCVATYFRADFPSGRVRSVLFGADVWMFVAFLLCTYRSYRLIFMIMKLEDSDIKRNSAASKTEYNHMLDKDLKELQAKESAQNPEKTDGRE